MTPIGEQAQGGLDERGQDRGGRQKDPDLAVAEVQVGPDQG